MVRGTAGGHTCWHRPDLAVGQGVQQRSRLDLKWNAGAVVGTLPRYRVAAVWALLVRDAARHGHHLALHACIGSITRYVCSMLGSMPRESAVISACQVSQTCAQGDQNTSHQGRAVCMIMSGKLLLYASG